MEHLSLEAGRRRRWTRFEWGVVGALAALSAVATQVPESTTWVCPVFFFGVVGALCVAAHLIRRRNQEVYGWYLRGRCLTCGYDLRTNEVRCPECGRPSGPLRL